jgi:hypothetical protein
LFGEHFHAPIMLADGVVELVSRDNDIGFPREFFQARGEVLGRVIALAVLVQEGALGAAETGHGFGGHFLGFENRLELGHRDRRLVEPVQLGEKIQPGLHRLRAARGGFD